MIKNFLLFSCLFTGILFPSKIIKAQKADQEIADLLNKSDFFELERRYPALKPMMKSPMLKTMTESLLYSYFNKPKEAAVSIQSLLSNYQQELGTDNALGMLYLLISNLFESQQYAVIVSQLETSMPLLENQMKEEGREYLEDMLRLSRILKNRPLPKITKPGRNHTFPFTLKKAGLGSLIYVPVRINGLDTCFIFDTGANQNFVSQSFAEKHQIRLLGDTVVAAGLKHELVQIGTIDSMEIGGYRYYNPIFFIGLPDEAIDTFHISFDAVLGSSFMRAVGEIQIYPDEKKMLIPDKETTLPAYGKNLLFSNGLFYVRGSWNKNPILMHFDSGNASESLHSVFYLKNKEWVEKNGVKDTSRYGGLGGVSSVTSYCIPKFTFTIGKKTCTLKDREVNTEQTAAIERKEDGALGVDFILSQKKLTLNFNDMFLDVK